MEITEIRIGNFIANKFDFAPPEGYPETFYIVESILCDSSKKLDSAILTNTSAINLQNCKGIPISKEWLIKFGFEMQRDNGILNLDEIKDGITIAGQSFMIDTDGVFCIGGYDSCCSGQYFEGRIEFIHQLQNLIFGLTGKELKIN